MLTYGSTRFLLMGDAHKRVEEELLREGVSLSADVLKVGHHGASDVLSNAFLTRVNPAFAVISINKDNVRGYPSPSVLRRLRNRGIGVFLTYEHGTVEFISDGEGIRVRTDVK
jgi:competence protein ComEC